MNIDREQAGGIVVVKEIPEHILKSSVTFIHFSCTHKGIVDEGLSFEFQKRTRIKDVTLLLLMSWSIINLLTACAIGIGGGTTTESQELNFLNRYNRG